MNWILQIDTTLEVAIISLAKDGRLVGEKINHSQKDHASFLHPAVADLMKEAGVKLNELDAIAVVNGPGSYTGLRVGLAAAKGFCFALKIPLITIDTLQLLAANALPQIKDLDNYGTMLVCPMIDARRMEVYTALYTSEMDVISAPKAVILERDFMFNFLLNNLICFFGTGSEKWKTICENKNAFFIKPGYNSLIISELCYRKNLQKDFSEIAYLEPFYLKEFYLG